MRERDEKRGGSGCVVVGLVLTVLFLPVLYVLSIGPAHWIAFHNPSTQPFLQWVYSPLVKLMLAEPTAGKCLDWYLNLWV